MVFMLSTPVAHKINNDSRKYDSFMTCLSLLYAEQKVCRTTNADASPTIFSSVLSLIGSLRDMYEYVMFRMIAYMSRCCMH